MRRVFFAFVPLVALALWLLSGRGLGVSGEWVLQPNAQLWPTGAWGLPLAVPAIFGGAAALCAFDRFRRAKTEREKRNSTGMALFFLGVLLFLWPWALLGPGSLSPGGGPTRLTLEGRFNIVAALWSDVATEYFGAAYQIQDARRFGRDYAARWQKPVSPFQAHVATHPPGAVLWFYAARRVYEAVPPLQSGFERLAVALTRQPLGDMAAGAALLRDSASRGAGAPDPAPLPPSAIGGALWCAGLLGLALVTSIPAVYGLARGDVGDAASSDAADARGLLAVALWVLAPTTNLFAFTLDAPIAAGAVWTLFFVAQGLRPGKSARWMVAAGVAFALTSFLSVGALALGVVIALTLWRRDAAKARGLELAGAFAATWLLLALVFAFNPLAVLLNAMEAHRFATLRFRSYAPWAAMNLLVWAAFAGFALVAALFKRPRALSIAQQIGWAALATLLLLTLSGNVRGEVERLWLFLLAPLAVCAASDDLSARETIGLLCLQGVQTLLLAATLGPLVRP